MKSPTMRVLALAGLGFAARCPAGDEYSFFFTVSNDVTPEQPSTTVTLWAAFPPHWYAFAKSQLDVATDPDPGMLSDPTVLIVFDLIPGDVAPDGDRVTNIYLQQFQFLGGMYADTSNPIAVWSVTWSTDDFTPRQVPIWTVSRDFWIFVDDAGGAQDFYGPDFSEAQGTISVLHPCYADFTADGVLDLFDFLAYVNTFNGGDPDADCDTSGTLDLFDFLCFVNAFNAGC